MTAPSVEYAQLSPMLIIFGVAVAGVLAEAGPQARELGLRRVALFTDQRMRASEPYAAVAAFPAQSRAAVANADPGPSSGDAPATPA